MKVAVWPTETVWFAGCVTITGAVGFDPPEVVPEQPPKREPTMIAAQANAVERKNKEIRINGILEGRACLTATDSSAGEADPRTRSVYDFNLNSSWG